jgi:hypothetical protein
MTDTRKVFCALMFGAAMMATPALAASETLFVDATTPDGGVTTNLYSGKVRVGVSGISYLVGNLGADAFYTLFNNPPYHDPNFYQLTFGTSPLVPLDPAQDAVNFMPGGLPAYNPGHLYSFILDTGLSTPGQLHFGFSDGIFGDNSGGYTVTVASVPEPGTWAMLVIGAGAVGGMMRARRRRWAAKAAA